MTNTSVLVFYDICRQHKATIPALMEDGKQKRGFEIIEEEDEEFAEKY